MGVIIQDGGENYKAAIRASRLLPPEGFSGVYAGDIGIFYKPLERTDALFFSAPADGPNRTALSFNDILIIYPLLSESGRSDVAISVREAAKKTREVQRQFLGGSDNARIAEEHARYLEFQFEIFYRTLTSEERAVVDEALK